MKCPKCKHDAMHTVQNSGFYWCSSCGALARLFEGRMVDTKSPEITATKPGLLLIAAEALRRVNERLTNAVRSPGAWQVESLDDLVEAISAIIHELEARDAEPKPATADPNTITARLIEAGVIAVQQERERCAKIADAYTTWGTEPGRLTARTIAHEIRTPDVQK